MGSVESLSSHHQAVLISRWMQILRWTHAAAITLDSQLLILGSATKDVLVMWQLQPAWRALRGSLLLLQIVCLHAMVARWHSMAVLSV